MADVSRFELAKRDAGASISTRSSDARITTLAHLTENGWRTCTPEVHRRDVDAASALLTRTARAGVGIVTQWSVESAIGAFAVENAVYLAYAKSTVLTRIARTRVVMLTV